MSTAFRAIVSECVDRSRRAANGDYYLKAARFDLESVGPFPWPPSTILGHEIIVVPVAEFRSLLERTGETDLIEKLWPPKKPTSPE